MLLQANYEKPWLNRWFPFSRQSWLTMKLTATLLISFMLNANAHSFSQVVTFSGKNVSLEKIFMVIEQQTGYLVFYNYQVVKGAGNVTINAKAAPLEKFLQDCLRDRSLMYVIEGKTIIVQPKDEVQRFQSALAPPPFTVTGRVTDDKGNPMAGASIKFKGTSIGANTDVNGNFSIQAPAEGGVLVISYIGYEMIERPVSAAANLNLEMKQQEVKMENVVVVGYGTQKKVNLTGAVDVVSGEALQNRSAANVSELMTGISPNLNIAMSNRGGEPGAARSWNLRGLGSISGNSSPLILVDGVESNIDNLDPESIESVSILKDASASAIYGSRAPFGVVLITTKKGQKNKGIKIQYNNNLAWASPLRLPEFVDALTWATVYNETQANSGLAPVYPDEQVERIRGYLAGTYKNEYDVDNPPRIIWNGRWQGNANYNWPKLFFRQNSFSPKHNINLQGGDDKTQYYVSAGYYNQGGLYNWGNDSYKRYNIMANVSSKATDWLRFDFGVRYAQTSTDYPLGIVGTPRDYNFRAIFSFAPMTPMYNVDGSIANPLVLALKNSGRNETSMNDLWLKIGTEIEPLKGWKTNIAYNYNVASSANIQNPKPVPVPIPNGDIGNIGTSSSGSYENVGATNYYIFNALTSYEKTTGGHFVKLMVGYEQELNKYRTLYGSRMNLITDQVPSINAAVGETTLGATRGHWATQAVFGRLNYNFREKYLLEFSGRYNGSSRFAKDSRWGFFPSVSAGYNISKEDFWTPVSRFINTFKLRASYGSLGNQNVPNYLYLSTIPVFSNLNYIIDNSRPIYAQTPAIVSADLTWETVTTLNVGMDAATLGNRLNASFDWYNRKTTNMFGPSKDLPAFLGASAPFENNAELETKGFELSVDWRDHIGSDVNYNVKVSIGDSRSTITKYNNSDKLIDNWFDGNRYGDIWGFETESLIQKAGESMADQSKYYSSWGPGDVKYKDLDGNGVVNDGKRTLNDHGDLVVIGNTSPRYSIGISAGFTWKGFGFNMFWQGIAKRDYLPNADANVFYGIVPGGSPGSESSIMKGSPSLDYWRPADEANMLGPNTDAYFPKPYFTDEWYKNHLDQSRFVLNAAYLRLKNLQLSYTIPKKISKKAFIEAARIYVSGENLVTLTSLPKVLDPETSFASDSRLGGLEPVSAVYPISRMLSVGLNLTF